MTVKLLIEHDLEFLSLKGGCTGSSESTIVKMPHCWKSHDTAQLYYDFNSTMVEAIHCIVDNDLDHFIDNVLHSLNSFLQCFNVFFHKFICNILHRCVKMLINGEPWFSTKH